MKLTKKFMVIGVMVLITLGSLISPAVFSITVKEEEDMSRQMMAMIYKHFDVIDDPVIVPYVNKIGQRILASLPPQPFKYHFHVINQDVYNAFATPAGHIFVYTGLLNAMQEEEELAGIMGHEIAHVYCRHISQKIERSKKISMATMAGVAAGILMGLGGAGEAAGAVTMGSMAAGQSAELAYSRENEMQADQFGVEFLPSPADIPPIQGTHPETGDIIECQAKDSDPLAALIFKVSMAEGRKLSFVRVYSGKMKVGEELYNPFLKKREKLTRILQMHANKRERVETVGAGSIVGVIGLKDSSTGETLCNSDRPVLLEKIEIYEPVISVAVEPKTHADQEKIDVVLEKFLAEDPTLRVRQDEDTGQTILSGMGELHLEIITSRMQREFNTNVNVGQPQVVYRETIANTAKTSALFDKEIAGQRQYGDVTLSVAPLPRGSGTRFRSGIGEDELAQVYREAVEKGALESLESGALMGYPVVDVEITLAGVNHKDALSTELAYTVSASMACREALAKAAPFLLEPIMDVEVFVPEAFTGEVIGDLNARGGKIESIDHKMGSQVLRATVPLARMFGYSTSLRSATQGRGTFSMQFSHFDRS